MEAEVLAATSLLAEGIALKQDLQFLVGRKEDPGDNSKVEMKMFLDSISAQAFFQRLGPGRGAKRLRAHFVGARGHAPWMVQDWKNPDQREPCRPQYKGNVKRTKRVLGETHWFA